MPYESYELYRDRVISFYRTRRRMPSYREMADVLGFASKNAAYRVARKLMEDGIAARDRTGALLPGPRLSGVPVLGVVEAGFPAAAEEEVGDTMSIDEYLIDNHPATYLLTVKGDSMKDAGIMEGDLVVAERANSARVGDIVIAEVDGEYTMKYLRKKDGHFYLEAANDAYPDMYPDREMRIAAVVRGVVRKYK